MAIQNRGYQDSVFQLVVWTKRRRLAFTETISPMCNLTSRDPTSRTEWFNRLSFAVDMNKRTEVLIVEDEWIVARAVQKILESAGYHVCEVVSTAAEALTAFERTQPDLALVDIVLSDGSDGVELARKLRSRAGMPVIFVTAYSDMQTLARAADIEPAGYVVKPFQEGQLLSAVTMALKQAGVRATNGNGNGAAAGHGAGTTVDGPVDSRQQRLRGVAAALARRPVGEQLDLTSRELEVVRLLLSNGRVRSIAEQLDISPHTVRNHLRSIFRKLGVHSQVELIRELSAERVGAA